MLHWVFIFLVTGNNHSGNNYTPLCLSCLQNEVISGNYAVWTLGINLMTGLKSAPSWLVSLASHLRLNLAQPQLSTAISRPAVQWGYFSLKHLEGNTKLLKCWRTSQPCVCKTVVSWKQHYCLQSEDRAAENELNHFGPDNMGNYRGRRRYIANFLWWHMQGLLSFFYVGSVVLFPVCLVSICTQVLRNICSDGLFT